jgi:hypothetical protein
MRSQNLVVILEVLCKSVVRKEICAEVMITSIVPEKTADSKRFAHVTGRSQTLDATAPSRSH